MNERIEELAKQCYVSTGSPHTDHFEYWKFAELLVRECEQLSLKNSHRNDDMGAIIAKQIKKHFGVE